MIKKIMGRGCEKGVTEKGTALGRSYDKGGCTPKTLDKTKQNVVPCISISSVQQTQLQINEYLYR